MSVAMPSNVATSQVVGSTGCRDEAFHAVVVVGSIIASE